MDRALPLIVFSHLRWDFVYQRPQHLLSRFAQWRTVIVIEEPIYTQGPAYWEYRAITPTLKIYRPHTPLYEGGFSDRQHDLVQTILPERRVTC